MCTLVAHPGPDSRGTFTENGVRLAMQRLAVVDVAEGDQPIFNEDGSIVVVLNGEIYNYVELREGLQRRGNRLATHSDTEVIVHRYEDNGLGWFDFLRGMFAFALWNRRRRRLLLARDMVGKKPLFYSQRGETIWFAYEPRAILADSEIPRDVIFAAVDSFLQLSYVADPETAFAMLRNLPLAHTLSWEDGRAEVRRY